MKTAKLAGARAKCMFRAASTLQAAHASPGEQQQQQRSARPRHNTFRFREFDLHHGSAGMKMGTDAMLLGSWSQPPPVTSAVLDAGTGSGVLALMMAQKTQQQRAVVHAIDIDAAAVAQAADNAAASPWAERLLVAQSSLQTWPDAPAAAGRYDIVISNPPFFLQSSKPGAAARAAARHADLLLPFDELAAAVARLLRPSGRLCLVLPTPEAARFEAEAACCGLLLTRLLKVFTKAGDAQPKRHLMQFERLQDLLLQPPPAAASSRGAAFMAADQAAASSSSNSSGAGRPVEVEQLVVMEQHMEPRCGKAVLVYSQQYQQLTRDFHHPDLFKARYGSSG